MRISILLTLCCVIAANLQAQTIIHGQVLSSVSDQALQGAIIEVQNNQTITDRDGNFTLPLAMTSGKVLVSIGFPGYQTQERSVELTEVVDLGVIRLVSLEDMDQLNAEDIIPTVTLSLDQESAQGDQNISGLLTASRDVFLRAAAFQFGAARFRVRGYDSEYTTAQINGLPINDLESGRIYWSIWGGLNDVTRLRSNTVGLGTSDYAFGGVGGASTIDTRAGSQRKQLRVGYARANRTYRNRLMATWSSGQLPRGWAVSLSASSRWAEEGYVEGTPYEAFSYFASVDKILSPDHQLNLTVFGAPNKRGRSTAVVQELYDVAGTNFYNPYWGYQSGEKRNSRIANRHQPVVSLRHDWHLSDQTHLTTSIGLLTGRNGSTAINWFDAADPRPDYYRRLPSFLDDEQGKLVTELLARDVDARQINWHQFYDVNRNHPTTIYNTNGFEGRTVTGNQAQYVIEDRRYDPTRIGFNTMLNSVVSDAFTVQGGLTYQKQRTHNFKVLADLLGADFWLDVNPFVVRDFPNQPALAQSDISRPNRIVEQGESFGYDFNNHIRTAAGWLQGYWSLPRVDFFLSGQIGSTRFWREGLMQNGLFANNSLGESDKPSFFTYGVKGGLTLKIDGRNYLIANAARMTQAPFLRNAQVSSRTRNQFANNLENEVITSFEGGYFLKAPRIKARLTGYYTTFENQITNRNFFLDNGLGEQAGFVNLVLSNIETEHLGLEAAFEVEVLPGLQFSGVAALGQYLYKNRPDITLYLDQTAEGINYDGTVYLQNFYVPNTPQVAGTLGLGYNSPHFWFATVNVNYFDRMYLDFYPLRRTTEAIQVAGLLGNESIPEGSDLYNSIIHQARAPEAITVDFFGGKSFKFNKTFLYFNLGVSNILDKRDFRTGGYEQFRFDFRDKDVGRFPNRHFYAYGRTFFASLALRI